MVKVWAPRYNDDDDKDFFNTFKYKHQIVKVISITATSINEWRSEMQGE